MGQGKARAVFADVIENKEDWTESEIQGAVR